MVQPCRSGVRVFFRLSCGGRGSYLSLVSYDLPLGNPPQAHPQYALFSGCQLLPAVSPTLLRGSVYVEAAIYLTELAEVGASRLLFSPQFRSRGVFRC